MTDAERIPRVTARVEPDLSRARFVSTAGDMVEVLPTTDMLHEAKTGAAIAEFRGGNEWAYEIPGQSIVVYAPWRKKTA